MILFFFNVLNLFNRFTIYKTFCKNRMIDKPLLEKEWVPLHLREKLSFIHILGIAASNLAPNILWMIIPTFFEPIAYKIHVSKISQTILLFFGSFSGFAVCPIIGVYSDRSTCKWGRRRIYIVISLFMIIIGLVLLSNCISISKFLSPKNPDILCKILFGFSYLFSVTAGNILQTPARSICTDVSPLPQQNLMSNICSVYAGLGGVIVNIIGGLKLENYTSLNQEQFILIVSAVLCSVSILITIIVTPEEPLQTKPPKVRPFKQLYEAFKTMPIHITRTLPSVTLLTIAYFQFSFQFNHFMGKDVFKGDNTNPDDTEKNKLYDEGVSWSMFCGAVRYGSQFLYGFACTKVSEIIGFKWASFLGYLLLSIGLFLFFVLDNKYWFLLVTALIGIGYGTAMSIPYAIASIAARINNQDFGVFVGILVVFTVIGEQLSNLGIGSGLGMIWPDNPRVMIGISGIFGVLAAFASLWIIEPKIEMNESYASLATEGD